MICHVFLKHGLTSASFSVHLLAAALDKIFDRSLNTLEKEGESDARQVSQFSVWYFCIFLSIHNSVSVNLMAERYITFPRFFLYFFLSSKMLTALYYV